MSPYMTDVSWNQMVGHLIPDQQEASHPAPGVS